VFLNGAAIDPSDPPPATPPFLQVSAAIKRVTEIAWDHAVNDTANLWQSVFWHALGPEQARERIGDPCSDQEDRNGFFLGSLLVIALVC
jgi:hypothetical protein